MKRLITELKKINLPQIIVGLVLFVTLLFGLPLGNTNSSALAALNRNIREVDTPIGDYPTDVQTPNQQQTQKNYNNNSQEKENKLPKSTRKFFKQIQGKAPIDNTTPPYPEKSKPATQPKY